MTDTSDFKRLSEWFLVASMDYFEMNAVQRNSNDLNI